MPVACWLGTRSVTEGVCIVSRVVTVLLKLISDSFLHRDISYIINLYTTICP